jgi:hypothetical protein
MKSELSCAAPYKLLRVLLGGLVSELTDAYT